MRWVGESVWREAGAGRAAEPIGEALTSGARPGEGRRGVRGVGGGRDAVTRKGRNKGRFARVRRRWGARQGCGVEASRMVQKWGVLTGVRCCRVAAAGKCEKGRQGYLATHLCTERTGTFAALAASIRATRCWRWGREASNRRNAASHSASPKVVRLSVGGSFRGRSDGRT